MKTKHTVIMLAVVACLCTFAFIAKNWKSTDEMRDDEGKVFDLNADDVSAFEIRSGEGTFEFTKLNGVWELTAPVKDRAEASNVITLLTTLEGLRMRKVNEAKDKKQALKDFGLGKGEVSIKVWTDKPDAITQKRAEALKSGKPLADVAKPAFELLLGKEHAVEGRIYARLESSDEAYVASKDVRDQAGKGIKEWRSHTLSSIPASQATKMTLKTATGELEAERRGADWWLNKPYKARGDNQKITDLLSTALTAHIGDFLTESKDLGAYGLNEPRGTLTIYSEATPDPLVLQIGSPKVEKAEEKSTDKEKKEPSPDSPAKAQPAPTQVYVKASSREGVVTVPIAVEGILKTQPNEIRDQFIMRVQSDMVDRISIEAPGKAKVILARKGEEWVRSTDGKNELPANSQAANSLLQQLVTTKIVRPVADLASDLKQYGLDQPVATVTLSSFSTEGTPEEAPGDRPMAKLYLGNFVGDAGFAKLDDEPFIVAIPNSIKESIWTDPLQWQDLRILALNPEDIVTLEITQDSHAPRTFSRDKEKAWKLSKGDGTVNQIAAGSLVNTLSSLRAVRWVGATDAEAHGMVKPSIVVHYTLADKSSGKLILGAKNPDEMWYATLEGKPGTFVVSRPDYEAFATSLIEPQKSAGSPSSPQDPKGDPAPPPVSVPTPETPPVTPPPPSPSGSPPPAPSPAISPAPATPK